MLPNEVEVTKMKSENKQTEIISSRGKKWLRILIFLKFDLWSLIPLLQTLVWYASEQKTYVAIENVSTFHSFNRVAIFYLRMHFYITLAFQSTKVLLAKISL